MEVAVIGTGVTGISAASALIARGVNVTIIDGGEQLSATRAATVAKLRELPQDRWAAEDLQLIGEKETFDRKALPKKSHFGSDYIYAKDRPDLRLDVQFDGNAPYPTLAVGGFSNIWGGAMLPVAECDMADWPISRSALDPYFKKVATLVPLCGGEGTLSTAFPAYKENLGRVDPGPQGRLLLEDLRRAERGLLENQILYGEARLAVHTERLDDETLPCNGCGHCFMGCVRGSIYSTIPLLKALKRDGKVKHLSGLLVTTVGEVSDGAEVSVIDMRTKAKKTLKFDALFLAAGPINTTRILLRTRELFDTEVRLKESQKFLLPMLRLRSGPTAIEVPSITLASVFIEAKVPEISDHWLHIQVISMNMTIIDGARLPGTSSKFGRHLWAPILRRTTMAWCGMHSDHSSHVLLRLKREAQLAEGDVLEMGVDVSSSAGATARQAARSLFRKGFAFGSLFCYWMIKFGDPGSGTHCGSSFPMRRLPTKMLESDALGRPYGWKRIHAVDTSVLPSIPGTTIAFPAMANAYRIGNECPLSD